MMFGNVLPRQRRQLPGMSGGNNLMGENAPALPAGLDPNMPWPVSGRRTVQPYQMPPVVPQDEATPAAKPSFMGQGGAGRAIAGTIGDTLLQYNGMDPVFAPQQAAQQKLALEAQQRQAERENKFTDWRRQYDYQRVNPAPTNNDTVNDYNFILQNLGEDAAKQYLRNMGDPTVTVPLGRNQVYSGPRSGLGGAMQKAAPPEVLPSDFDFGGGGVSNGTGNFR